ncbi:MULTISPECIES: anti-sigma factor [Rhizobium]|uniref:Anti-sigma factor n=1 Tax=Rhizobium rhododendri TaxID=2506430 RepID=A0ABY8IHC0_9HYPH|nr:MULTISPECIES: anti-sigma factor [Rhizobium]MBZ5759867.1 anti-sigma factor [Rhizobium sp. VS19-DR96]MBZ5766255.1 anti-sigma factor [Rhizobium sp. VS19-DR129.2]MBZ5773038.1 anti-sigma factor [Rhizobium sp. VS19-DRK62.2]MBZ5784022.1 anti-sigma factor [Rhizobium sp. VS19-DR121]MBZ5803599.1 anti-sigma factor [Rhizobium sp. VS19-DR181]
MSSPDQSKGGRSRDEVLAGEYVLGVLSLEDRQKVETRMRSDRPFAAIVNRWEQNLSSFNDEYEAILPPASVFPKVEKRIFGERPKRRGGVWNSLPVWRGLTLASLVLAAGAIFYDANGGLKVGSGSRRMVADLAVPASVNGALNLVASYDTSSGRLKITPVAAAQTEKKSLELWLIKGSDPAKALGVLPQSGEGEIAVPANMRSQFGEGATIAISVEPFGGSPSGAPTGPVIAAGKTRSL